MSRRQSIQSLEPVEEVREEITGDDIREEPAITLQDIRVKPAITQRNSPDENKPKDNKDDDEDEIQEVPAITKRLSFQDDEKICLNKKNKVLIGIDNSLECEKAFEWYADLLHRPDNEVLLVHVAFPPFVSTQQVMYMTNEHWSHIIGEEKTKVKLLEDKYATRMRAKKMSGRIKALFHQKIGEALVDVAKDEKVNHIVLGSRGQDVKSTSRHMMGSTSEYVINHVFCPVSVYRDEDAPAASRRRSSLSSLIINIGHNFSRRNSAK